MSRVGSSSDTSNARNTKVKERFKMLIRNKITSNFEPEILSLIFITKNPNFRLKID